MVDFLIGLAFVAIVIVPAIIGYFAWRGAKDGDH
jgi:hypothetical protein